MCVRMINSITVLGYLWILRNIWAHSRVGLFCSYYALSTSENSHSVDRSAKKSVFLLLYDGTVSIRFGGSHFTAANLLLTNFGRRELILLKFKLIGGLLHLVYLKRIEADCWFRNRASWDKLLLTHITLVIDSVTLVTLFLDKRFIVVVILFGKSHRWRLLLERRTMTWLIYCSELLATISYLLWTNINTIL